MVLIAGQRAQRLSPSNKPLLGVRLGCAATGPFTVAPGQCSQQMGVKTYGSSPLANLFLCRNGLARLARTRGLHLSPFFGRTLMYCLAVEQEKEGSHTRGGAKETIRSLGPQWHCRASVR